MFPYLTQHIYAIQTFLKKRVYIAFKMKSVLVATFFLPVIKCNFIIDEEINNLDQNDPKLADFIRDHLLEPPPIFPESIEDMNTEVISNLMPQKSNFPKS